MRSLSSPSQTAATHSAVSREPPRTRVGRGVRAAGVMAMAVAALALAGCASSGVGIGIGLVPGLSLNLGVGSGGPSIGLGTGWGPVGAGVSVDGSGRVVGSTGVGVSAGPVGVGLAGQSAVLYDPQVNSGPPSIAQPAVEPGVVVRRSGAMWRPPAEVEAP